MMKIWCVISMLVVSLYAENYIVLRIDGKKVGEEPCFDFKECINRINSKYSKNVFLLEKNDKMYRGQQNARNIASRDTVYISSDDSISWIEMEKNSLESLCLSSRLTGMWVLSDSLYSIQSDNCVQINTGNVIKLSTVKYIENDGKVNIINVLVGMKLIDLSKTTHLLGFYGKEYDLKEKVIYSDPLKDFNNRIYPDPERKESINEVLIVDKYPVTNCDFIQVLWDSIPRVSMSKNENMTRYHNHWIERKEKMIKNERCDTHDSAAIKIYLYDALIYANARSVRDGFEPVYKFERIRQKNYIPSLYENGDFDVFTMSFFEKYEDSDANWLRVKVDKSANGYRLPYYDEWMALARGGTANRRYIWGENEDPAIASQYAWFGAGKVISEKYGVYQQDSRPVGMLKPNAYGLYDMLGLVCENVMLPGKSIFANEITSCKGGFLYDSLEKLNFGAHEDNWNAGYGGYQGLRLVRQIK